jgi:hypothetical protein
VRHLSDHDWRKLRAQTEASLTRRQRWQIERARAVRVLGFDLTAKQTRDRYFPGERGNERIEANGKY